MYCSQKLTFIVSALLIASVSSALTIDFLGENEIFNQVSFDAQGRPYISGESTGAIKRVCAAAATTAGALRWSRVIDTDPLGANKVIGRVTGNNMTIGWSGAYNRVDEQVGCHLISNATGATVNSTAYVTTELTSLGYATIAANGAYYVVGHSRPAGAPQYSGAVFSWLPGNPNTIAYQNGAANQSLYYTDSVILPNSVVVTGYSLQNSVLSAFVAKYDRTTYAQLWFTTIPNIEAYPRKMLIDSTGNFFVAGDQRTLTGQDTFFAKLSPNGTLLAQTSMFTPGTDESVFDMCMVGGLTPAICGSSNSNYYVATASANLSSTQGVVDTGTNSATSMAQDGTNFYAASGSGMVIKFNSIGQTFWTRDHSGVGNVHGVGCNGTSVYLAGSLGSDGQLSKLNGSNGDLVW